MGILIDLLMVMESYILQTDPSVIALIALFLGILGIPSLILAILAYKRKSPLSTKTIELDMKSHIAEIQELFSTLCNIIRMDYNDQDERNDVNEQLVTFFNSNSSLIKKTIKDADNILTRYKSDKIIKRKIYANLELSLKELKWVRDYFKPTKFDKMYNIDNNSVLWITNIQQFHIKNSKLQSIKIE